MTASAPSTDHVSLRGCPEFDRSAPVPPELLVRFAPYFRRLIRKYGTTPELRQDLVGEVYCILHDLIQAYDPTRGVPFSAYLFSQLRAGVFSRARKEWKVQSREICTCPLDDDWWEIQQAVGDTFTDELNLREWLREALGALTERQRTVVYLRYFQGRPFEEIAEIMHIQVASTRSLLRNGIHALRALLRANGRQLSAQEHRGLPTNRAGRAGEDSFGRRGSCCRP